ncbi:MAG: radical SAM protein [Elusimicrobiales bacterium]|jgi:MoaA/NifB/PqqE/SkfB family radical SAM enzyme
MITRLDIKISFRCNNLCGFCAQGRKRDRYPDRSAAVMETELKKAYGLGVRGVVFTGGEPSLHPALLGVIRTAAVTGYKTIQLQTNGRALAYPGFCRELKEAGLTEFGPSLHGASPGTHDSLTGAEGSFAQSAAGIANAAATGLPVLSNTVVTSVNYRELPEIAALLIKLGVSQYQFAFIHMVGSAAENKNRLVPRKTAVMPYLKKALDLGIKKGVPCYTEAIPFCLMKGYDACVAERLIPSGPVVDADRYIEDYGAYRRSEGKAKGPRCAECACAGVCEGPWREYPALYGWSEFKPVRDPRRGPARQAPPQRAAAGTKRK